MNLIYSLWATEDDFSSVRRSYINFDFYDSGGWIWLLLSEEKWIISRYIW